jgi:hypothetical protein
VLQARGWSFAESLEQCDVALCSRFDARMNQFFKRGGRGVFLFERPEDFPAGLKMRLSRASSRSGFLWLRSDSAVFSGLTERWIPPRAFSSLAAPFFIDGIGGSNFRDVLAGYLVAEEEFFQPVMVMFRLGHGSGIMCTFPLRRLCAEGDRSALFLLEAALRSLRSGALPMPRFEPAVSEREFLVPLSRDGSALWRLCFQKPAGLWYGKAFKDRSWKRSRGGFGRRGAPGIVIRYTCESPEIFLRTCFHVKRMPAKLVLHLFHDREITVAVNGEIVFERDQYTSDIDRVELAVSPGAVLQQGENLLAVHCRQEPDSHNLDVGIEAFYCS